MKEKMVAGISILGILFCVSWAVLDTEWLTENRKGYSLLFTSKDADNKQAYLNFTDQGIEQVKSFFGKPFSYNFSIIVHPSRASLDSTWKANWHEPYFRSECWMVASGVSDRLDILSPVKWEAESCEHSYQDQAATQQLITHELIHVYHGQLNKSPDLSKTDHIDWLVEGLATYGSGQLSASKKQLVRGLITQNQVPDKLSKFWTGPNKYALSGSMAWFIDTKYGRKALLALLPYSTMPEVLEQLGTTEEILINDWRNFLLSDQVK